MPLRNPWFRGIRANNHPASTAPDSLAAGYLRCCQGQLPVEEAGTLQVWRTLTRTGGKHTIAGPKTKKSRRTVRLTAVAIAALQGYLKRQIEKMHRLGSLYKPGGLVFANEIGVFVNPSNLRNHSFARLLMRAQISAAACYHDLRHACATLLLPRNVTPKIVSEMLGHAKIAITLDTYSHVVPDVQEKTEKALEEALR